MKHTYLLCILTVVAAITMILGCTERGQDSKHVAHPLDTFYTQRAAMMVYEYDPVRALRIVDSAVIVGNLSDWWAEKNRMRIYSQTMMGERLDSMMHWTAGARFDSTRAIGERLLQHDSIKNSLEGQQDVLEMLVSAARQQEDTATCLKWLQQLVDVCRRQGSETEALRTEAEIGAVLCWKNRQNEGMAMLNRVIDSLSRKEIMKNDKSAVAEGGGFKFNELDALIIALKRKVCVLANAGQSAEILPPARRIVTLLDDYEKHPDLYHDSTYREPETTTERDDYIRFYRSKAQNYIVTAYAALGKTNDMNTMFKRLENILTASIAREQQARYDVLQQQMEIQRQRAEARHNAHLAWFAVIVALLTLCFAIYYAIQKRATNKKNRSLVSQISEAIKYKKMYEDLNAHPASLGETNVAANKAVTSQEEVSFEDSNFETLSHNELFSRIHDIIKREKLYLNPTFDRQAAIDILHLPKERIGSAFNQGSDYASITHFINDCRLEYACQLLASSDMNIDEVASASGFSVRRTFSRLFKKKYGLTPSEYRVQSKQM